MFGCSSNKNVDARVVNNALVVSFLTADPPRVWRRDMTGLGSSALELREGQPGKFRLVMRTGDGKEEDISTFTDKEDAKGALMAVTNAMLQGDIGSGAAPSVSAGAPKSSGFFGGLVKLVMWFVLILAVLWLFKEGVAYLANGSAHMAVVPQGIKSGTPIPADQLFGKK